jgi:hypothetical protein
VEQQSDARRPIKRLDSATLKDPLAVVGHPLAFYDPKFSVEEVSTRFPEAADQITDCLSGDVNKDFSQLWSWIREFVTLPEELPCGEPLVE